MIAELILEIEEEGAARRNGRQVVGVERILAQEGEIRCVRGGRAGVSARISPPAKQPPRACSSVSH